MIVILPSAKTFQHLKSEVQVETITPTFFGEARELVSLLKGFSVEELGQLMKMSNVLAEVNHERFQHFFEGEKHPVLLSFYGAMYKGIEAETFSEKELTYAQQTVRILSGLYGMLKPLDEIEEYRLEMATVLKNEKGANLYAFWKEKLTKEMLVQIEQSKGDKVLINLSSTEYSKALDLKEINKAFPVITITFKERKDDTYKLIGTYAKRARGLMVQFLAKNDIHTVEEIKQFDLENYVFNAGMSSEKELVFTRG